MTNIFNLQFRTLYFRFCQQNYFYFIFTERNFHEKCVEWRTKLAAHLKIMKDEAHEGELAAFASYAIAFPDGFLALVDTYDVSRYMLVLHNSIWDRSSALIVFIRMGLFIQKNPKSNLSHTNLYLMPF